MESGALGSAMPDDAYASIATYGMPPQPLPVQAPISRIGWRLGYRLALIATDAAVIALALLIAQTVRFGPIDASTPIVRSGVVLALIWLAALAAFRSRDVRVLGSGMDEYQRVAKATGVAFVTLAVLAVLTKVDGLSRAYLLVAVPLGLLLLLLERWLWRNWLRARRREGLCLISAYVVGPRADAERTVDDLVRHNHAGYRPVGVAFTDGDERTPLRTTSVDSLHRIHFDALPETVRATHTRAVIVAGDLPGGPEALQTLGWSLENSKTELILRSRLTDVAGPRIHMRPVEGLPMLHVDLPQYAGANHTIKRGIDVGLAGLAFLLLLPVIAVVALAVRIDSPGPVLFRQERIGVEGRRFTMFKFRSMVVDAEARLTQLAAENQGAGLLFKMQSDPRITRVGKFIRRYSLDELPQLFNVLNGSMSLIGPRPPLPREVAAYEGRVHRRLLIKPGITGLWQVSGRSNLSWEESVKLDLYYVENWSITQDFVILMKTVRAVVGRDGAY